MAFPTMQSQSRMLLWISLEMFFFAGTNLSVTCNITLGTEVNSDNITVNVSWFSWNSVLSNDTERIFISSLSGKKQSFTNNLLIYPLSDLENATEFKCQASASSDSMFIGKSGIGEISASILVHQKSQLYGLIEQGF